MIPIILGGAAAVSVFKIFKPKCIKCGSQFTLNKKCGVCNELVCGKCGAYFEEITYKDRLLQKKVRCCEEHVAQMNDKIATGKILIDKRIRAEEQSALVKTYVKNYDGHIEPASLGKTIRTEYFNDQEAAKNELKVLAAMDECFIVQGIVFNYQSQSDGNYKYKVWSATGVI